MIEARIGPHVIYCGDCADVLPQIDAESIQACVTDPPYGLGFMGRGWDRQVPPASIWEAVLRTLLPGAHLLAFFGTRTYHRGACAVEDAGFEIRDQIQWLYGSGFPKSMDVSKAIDKAAGAEREVIGANPTFRPNTRENGTDGFRDRRTESNITAPATDAAKEWEGFGTALKPANEPIVLARKPLIGTVVQNVLTHGVGGLNIDGCRVEATEFSKPVNMSRDDESNWRFKSGGSGGGACSNLGRWPANVIHDGSDEVVELFPEGIAGGSHSGRNPSPKTNGIIGKFAERPAFAGHADSGSAARFFYCAKASKSDRGEGNNHETVKPTALMRYLCRLVTPPARTILDPFMGSGSTGKAAILEGFQFVGIERDSAHFETAVRRIQAAYDERQALLEAAARAVDIPAHVQPALFSA